MDNRNNINNKNFFNSEQGFKSSMKTHSNHNDNHNTITKSAHKPDIKGLEKKLLDRTIHWVNRYRKDTDDSVLEKAAKSSLQTLVDVNSYLNDSQTDGKTGYLSHDDLAKAVQQLGTNKRSDAVITLLQERGRVYGLPKL